MAVAYAYICFVYLLLYAAHYLFYFDLSFVNQSNTQVDKRHTHRLRRRHTLFIQPFKLRDMLE